MPNPYYQFVRVDFSRFKAFDRFSIQLRHFNILVGPNNSDKSTILAAFRILAAAMRKATTRRPETVRGPQGHTSGYVIDLNSISVVEENIFYNYDDSEAATVKFTLSNGNALLLYFPEQGACYLIPDAQGRAITSTASFKSQFNCPVGFRSHPSALNQTEVTGRRSSLAIMASADWVQTKGLGLSLCSAR